MQTINLTEETYDLLVIEKGKLIATTGENKTFDETIQHLIKKK